MSLTLRELLDWVPEIADLAGSTRDAATNHADSAEFLHGLTKVSAWEGSGGDAARAAMTATAGHHDEAAQNLGRAAGGMEQAEHAAEDVANRIKALLNYADERPAVQINTSTNQVIPPSTDYLTSEAAAAVAAKVAGLQGQVAAVLARGEQVGADLARAISTATGVPTAPVLRDRWTAGPGHTGRRPPTPPILRVRTVCSGRPGVSGRVRRRLVGCPGNGRRPVSHPHRRRRRTPRSATRAT